MTARLCPAGHTARSFGCARPLDSAETHNCHAVVMEQQYSSSSGLLRMLQNCHYATQFCSLDWLSDRSRNWCCTSVLIDCYGRWERQVRRQREASERCALRQGQNWGWRSTECSTDKGVNL